MTLDEKASAIRLLRERCAAAGRDPAAVTVADGLPLVEGSVARSMERLPEIAAAGIDVVGAPLRAFVRDPDDAPATIEEIARRFSSAAGR